MKNIYLINPEWLKNFKDYYNYGKLRDSLESNKKFNSISYNNLDENIIKTIINDYDLSENILNFHNTELSLDLKKIENVNCLLNNKFKKYNNILFILEGIIIPSKIMKLIQELDKNLSCIRPEYLIFKPKNIIYINGNIIIISNVNFNLFIPKLVFIFNSKELFQNEKNKILNSNSIIEYIKLMKCNENENDNLQSLRNEKEEEIGKLIIINNDQKTDRKITNNNKEKKNSFSKRQN